MRPIDADALMVEVQKGTIIPDDLYGMGIMAGVDSFAKKLEAAPTLTLDDLRPKGRWIGTGYDGYADGCLVYDLWECSECRAEFGCVEDPPPYEFCPSCGADMRGGGEG